MANGQVLAKVRDAVADQDIGRYCFICGEPGVDVSQTAEGEVFICRAAGHRSPRAYIFDGKARFTFSGDRLFHESVGALVQRRAGLERQTLLFLRRRYPYQYTIPAGHLEMDRDPAHEMARELQEETGLTAHQASQIWPEEPLLIHGPCRRGADWHHWHVFQVQAQGQPCLSDEGRIIGWYRDQEIQDFAERDMLTAAVRVILQRLGVISRLAS
jgi:ADP-ribose pyrophosphatase YjhB (NUDIX family)